MAFRSTAARRFLLRQLPSRCILAPASAATRLPPPDPGDDERRFRIRSFLHRRRPISQAPSAAAVLPPAGFHPLAAGDKILETIRFLHPPTPAAVTSPEDEKEEPPRVSLVEIARARLAGTSRSSIAYPEFLEICGGEESVARSLDESGAVIVLGNIVFPRPEELARMLEKAIQASGSEEVRARELEELEVKKAAIDRAAAAGVRRELWAGLAVMAAQTAVMMRLTFWELSWDVMEPICFFVTSSYVLAGYAFFVLTARDPSFEGVFASRFASKQRRLMAARGFDLRRFDELSGAGAGRARV